MYASVHGAVYGSCDSVLLKREVETRIEPHREAYISTSKLSMCIWLRLATTMCGGMDIPLQDIGTVDYTKMTISVQG